MKQINVGLTGLSRAGKTVFLTAAIHHLQELTGEHLEEFRFHGWKYHGTRGKLKKDVAQFAYKDKLKFLFGDPPDWPEPTVDVTEYPVHLRLVNDDGATRECQISFLDYPGERLIDVALLDTTYDEWADDVESLFDDGPEEIQQAGETWRTNVAKVIEGKKDFPKSRMRATQLWFGEVCKTARDIGRPIAPVEPVLTPNDKGEVNAPFFPLTQAERKRFPETHDTMKKRYDRYLARSAKPFLRRIGVCDHQIVLIDLLGILSRGLDRYIADREQMHRILNCYRTLNVGWSKFFPRFASKLLKPGIRRVSFVATKADQALSIDRPNMIALLKELFAKAQTGLEFDHQTLRGFDFFAVASYAATEEVDQAGQKALKGRFEGESSANETVVTPGRVPASWPDQRSAWTQLNFPSALPPRHSDLPDRPLEHLNMDKVLFEILDNVV